MFLTQDSTPYIYDLKLEPHLGHWIFTTTDPGRLWVEYYGDFSKSNLMEWLKKYFEDARTPRFGSRCLGRHQEALVHAFVIVRQYADGGVPWNTVSRIVEGFMQGMELGGIADETEFAWVE